MNRNMHNQSLASMVTSLFLAASTFAAPLEDPGPGPVSFWNVTTFGDQNCQSDIIQNFVGSGPLSCQVLDDDDSLPTIPLSIESQSFLSVETQSVYVESTIGTYNFRFFPNQVCEEDDTLDGTLTQVYPVEGAQCISLESLSPESFTVDGPLFEKKSRRGGEALGDAAVANLESRKVTCEEMTTWEASTFTNADCTGIFVDDFAGGVVNCDNNERTCVPVDNSSIKSVLLSSASGTYNFNFYSNTECAVSAVNDPIYKVTTGETLCVPLPTGLSLRSIHEAYVGA